MPLVSFITLPQCLASAITLPMEMLNAADALQRSQHRHGARIKMHLLADRSGPLNTAGGLTLFAEASYRDIEYSDLILLPALWRNPLQVIRRQRGLLDWLVKMAGKGSAICAVGTSSFLLAEAGLLDHRPATTHWFYLDEFAQRYPKVQLKREFLITQAGNLYCAGTVNSVADLMVHLISQLYTPDIGHLVEAQFSPEIRQPFESHAYADQGIDRHRDELVIQAQSWLRERCQENTVDFEALAHTLGLTTRTFNRRFQQATGTTPGKYLQQQRVQVAKDLLRGSNLSIAEIAAACGYTDSSHFCARFRGIMHQTPLTYRKSVRGKIFEVI